MKKIFIFGNFSGRNAGDAAILDAMLHDITALYDDVLFQIPTINPGFVKRTCQQYPIQVLSLMPWTGSVKIFGIPTIWGALHTDLILITDAILFDRKLFNPLFNYLSTIGLIAPWAKRRGIPMVMYNGSFLPITTDKGRWFLKRVMDSCDQVIFRDRESADLIKASGIDFPDVQLAADCALNTLPCSRDRLDEIKRKENILSGKRPTIGFNINTYIDIYVRQEQGDSGDGIGRDRFTSIIAETIDRTVQDLDVDALMVSTQPMDLGVIRQALSKVQTTDRVKLVSNTTYSHRELAGILSQVDLFVGMRTHSLILASSQGTPIVPIIAYPKTLGYVRNIEQDDLMVTFDGFSTDKLFGVIEKAWSIRKERKPKLEVIIRREQEKARKSAEALGKYLG